MSKINSQVITYKLSQEEIAEKFKNVKPASKEEMQPLYGFNKGNKNNVAEWRKNK